MTQRSRTPAEILSKPSLVLMRTFSKELRCMWQEIAEDAAGQHDCETVNDAQSDADEAEGDEREAGGPRRSVAARQHVRALPSVSVLDRLSLTCSVWLLLGVDEAAVLHTLQGEKPGTFIVRRSKKTQQKVISVRWTKGEGCLFVRDYPILETQSGFSLDGSKLTFPDLCKLVAFYTTSRDILDFNLILPPVIQAASTQHQLESIAKMGIEFWCSSLHKDHQRYSNSSDDSVYVKLDPAGQLMNERVGENEDSGLCFVDPLFIQEQPACLVDGKAQLGQMLSQRGKAMISLSLPGKTASAGQKEVTVDGPHPEASDWLPAGPIPRLRSKPVIDKWRGTLRRTSSGVSSSSSSGSNAMSASSSSPGDNRLSTSSSELESDLDVESAHSTSHWNSQSGFNSTRGMRLRGLLPGFRNALGIISNTLQMPERRVTRRIKELASSRNAYFGCLVQDYVTLVKNGFADPTQACGDGKELLRSVRQTMTQFKMYLIQCNEIEPPLEAMISEHRIDDVVEKALYKCILKPLKATLEKTLMATHNKEGLVKRLQSNCFWGRSQLPTELGVSPSVNIPDPATQERIRAKLSDLAASYSPKVKVDSLLKVCKMVYDAMGSSGEGGADDFFPVLTYSLLNCDCPQLAIQVDYIMELLNPDLMSGESGYYLTSVYAALLMVGSLQEEQATPELAANTQQSLREWRRSRMTSAAPQHSRRSQNFPLMVSFRKCGSMTKPFSTRETVTAKEVCQNCATHFEVTADEAECFGLYAVTISSSGHSEWHFLKDSDCPHSVWAKLTGNNSTSNQLVCYFVYKPLDNIDRQCRDSENLFMQEPDTSAGFTPPNRDSADGNTLSQDVPATNLMTLSVNESTFQRANTQDHRTKL
ncbi:ras and Rab interactor 2-like [Lethenteron reissneri]|uniref:ras and Rab interactor 2-like n=1 Tax=Lethenteron reissneri TaxID=7753 RepID=UPI002AB7A3B3|nr:ras and Rab interactor 2-like [Lethenteron reissneri]